MWSSLIIKGVKSLAARLNNLILIDWSILHNSHLSLTIPVINLLLEGLSEPSASISVPQS